jgi:hypothetical protein
MLMGASEDGYSIEALAEPCAEGGFRGAVVVQRAIGGRVVVAYRNERLVDGIRGFSDRDQALRCALEHGRRVVRSYPSRLAC